MEIVLLDWTRMKSSFCLAGLFPESRSYRLVRPLPESGKGAAVRNVGWFPDSLDGMARWQVIQLIAPERAETQPPHVEDVWVRALRPTGRVVPVEQRRAILQTLVEEPQTFVFGAPLTCTKGGLAHIAPGEGTRSIATLRLPSERIEFSAIHSVGAAAADVRVVLRLGRNEWVLSVKDHHLLRKAELTSGDSNGQIRLLQQAVNAMGPDLAVRLGLSRAFQGDATFGSAVCWLMADGFFSMSDPQP